MMISNTSLVNDPNWFPALLSPDYQKILFVPSTPEQVSAAPFLDERFYGQINDRRVLDVSEIKQALHPSKAQLSWIFHSAFCCSTLLATALDASKKFRVLKEPQLIINIADAKRTPSKVSTQEFTSLLDLGLQLLQGQEGKAVTLIKPTNLCNNIADDILSREQKAIIIYSSLEDFLLSVAKKGDACRHYMRTQFKIFCRDPNGLADFSIHEAMNFTDLQIAALVWHTQIQLFASLIKKYPGQILTLTDREFLKEKAQTLINSSTFFSLPLPRVEAQKIVESSVFVESAKHKTQSFDTVQKFLEAEKAKAVFQNDIEIICRWAEGVQLGDAFTLPLDARLLNDTH